MEDALFFYNPWWTKELPGYLVKDYRRDTFYKLKEYSQTNRIIIIKGPRRAGKTTIMYQLIDDLLKSNKPGNILYLTFDDPKLRIDFDDIMDFYQIKILKKPLDETRTYIFMDEVQYLKNWQYSVKKYYDRNFPIQFIVSGSSATLIRKGTESLMGRTIEETLLPFSFKEFVEYRMNEKIPIDKKFPEIDMSIDINFIKKYEINAQVLFNKYLLKGGFPNIFNIPQNEIWQKAVAEDIIDKAIYRDITTLYGIKKPEMLDKLFLYLTGINGQILNINNISRSIGLSREYVNRYMTYLQNAYFLLTIKKFAKSIEKIARSNRKAYIIDPGIINSLLNKTEIDDTSAGHLVESIIAAHLVKYEVYYFRDQYEVDFILKIKDKLIPIEVKYKNTVNKKDTKGLLEFCNKFKINKGFIITKNQYKCEYVENINIQYIPVWAFLLVLPGSFT